jgi:hypothetical protein
MNECKEHPKYQGLRTPRSDCAGCWDVYRAKHSKPEPEPVMKKTRKPRVKRLPLLPDVSKLVVEAIEKSIDTIATSENLVKCEPLELPPKQVKIGFTKEVEKAIELAVEKAMKSIRYEHLHIPMSEFTIAKMNAFEKDGWAFKDCLRGDITRSYGLKVDTVVLTRIRGTRRCQL